MVSLHRANWYIPNRVPDFISQADYRTGKPIQKMDAEQVHMANSLSKVFNPLALPPDKTSVKNHLSLL
jgi:hypothetical protein